MKIFFSDKFKKELKTYGSYIKISTCRLGLYSITGEVDPKDFIASSEYIEFNALWYPETKSLNITLDLSDFVEIKELIESNVLKTFVSFYYSDINDNLQGLAFSIWNDRKNLNLCANSERKDLNYITVNFPKDLVANIETEHNAEFLESSSNIPGINTFLAVDGEYNSNDYITKDSYYKYVRNKISANNYDPLFLNGSGEKVYSITNYKHYTSIDIRSSLSGRLDDNGKDISYFTSGDSTVNILGTCTYDLYEVSNNEYKLKKTGCTEDISISTLYQILEGGGLSSTGEGCLINQADKTIEFRNTSDSDTNTFMASISFMSEVGPTSGNVVTINSNLLNFITYLSWTVDYSTNLTQINEATGRSHAVLLFDDYEGNTGWDIEGNNKAGYIVISSESKLRDPQNDIVIASEDLDSFLEFFDYDIEEDGYDTINKSWKYLVKITATKNCSEKDWFPLDIKTGSSKLILNTIKIENSEKSTSDVNFYCVQRTKYPLDLRRFQGGAWGTSIDTLTFNGTEGVKSISDLYVCGALPDYPYWEIVSDSTSFGLSQGSNKIADSTLKPLNISSSTFYTKASPNYRKMLLGELVIRRNNKNNSYDKTNWKDLIYCSPGNEVKVNVYIDKNPAYTTTSRVDSGTPYYYDENKLYIFDRYLGESQKFEIIAPDLSGDSEIDDLKIEYDNKELFEKYFDISIEKSKRSEYLQGEIIYIYNDNLDFNNKATRSTTLLAPTQVYKYDLINTENGKYYYTNSNISSSNVGTVHNDRVNSGLVGFIPNTGFNGETPEINTTTLRNVCVHAVTITPKILNESESKFDWYPKRVADNKIVPLWVKIGNETIYCVIKPDFSDTVKFYDSSLAELSKLKYLNSDDIVDSNFTRRKYLYVASSVDSSDFNYWYVYKKDPELSIRCDAHGYGSANEYKLISGDTKTWDGKEPTTIISTSTIAPTTEDYSFDPIVIKRSTFRYDNLLDLYSDWKMQMIEDYSFTLPVENEGKAPTSTMEISQITTSGELKKLEDDGLFELDRLGIYKLCVRSSNKFRVILSSNDDNFYFYDASKNRIKTSILMQDESRFDDILGREIYFAFLGKEDGNFESLEQTLKTTITVVNLDDNSSIVFHLHRNYFNKESNGVFSLPVIDSIITPANIGQKNIFFSDTALTREIDYKSFIESYVSFEKNTGAEGDVKLEDETININFNTYSTKEEFGSSSFISRGYQNNSITLKASGLENDENVDYPLHPVGTLNIHHKNNFNSRKLSYNIYKLIPVYELILNKQVIDIPYSSGKNSLIEMKLPENGEYTVEVKSSDSESSWTTVPIELIDGSYSKVNFGNGYSISRYANYGTVSDPDWITFIVMGPDEEFTGENSINVGVIRFNLFVDKDNFIYDENGRLNTSYTQDEVNELAGSSSKTVPIRRLSKKDSASTISGDFLTPIKKEGEQRDFTINKIESTATVEFKEYTGDNIGNYINGHSIVGNALSVSYASRLSRYGYNGGIRLGWSGNNLSTSTLNTLRKFSTSIEATENDTGSNFFLNITGSKDEVVKTENMTQELWTTGIRVLNSQYSASTDTYVYLGKTNNTVNRQMSHEGGRLMFFIDRVNLNPLEAIACPSISSASPGITSFGTIASNSTDARVPKYVLYVDVPENESYYNNSNYAIELTDGINSVTINITVFSNNDFELFAFKGYSSISSGDFIFTESDLLDDLVFSASGSCRESLYILTDAPSDFARFYLSIPSYAGSLFVNGESMNNKLRSISITTDLTSHLVIGVGKFRGKDYSIYRVTPTSRVSYINPYNNINTETCVGYLPFYTTKSCYFGIDNGTYSNSNYFTARYGSCNATLKGPYNTYLSVRNLENDSVEINKYADFTSQVVASELSKYTSSSNPSYLKTNKKLSGSYIQFDNTLYISYFDEEPLKYPLATFSDYGYYSSFVIDIDRKEWRKGDDGIWDIITLPTHVISGLDGACLVVPQGISRTIYRDNLGIDPIDVALTAYHNSTERYTFGDYSTGGGSVTCPDDSTGFPVAGVVINIPENSFLISNDTRQANLRFSTYSNDKTNNIWTDNVTFNINIKLILK